MNSRRFPGNRVNELTALAETYSDVRNLARKCKNYFAVQENAGSITPQQRKDHQEISEVIERMLPPSPPGPGEDLAAIARCLKYYFESAGHAAYVIQDLCGYILPEHISTKDLQEIFNTPNDGFGADYLVFGDRDEPKLLIRKTFLADIAEEALRTESNPQVLTQLQADQNLKRIVGEISPGAKDKLINDATENCIKRLADVQTFSARAQVNEESLRSVIEEVDQETLKSFVTVTLDKMGSGKAGA